MAVGPTEIRSDSWLVCRATSRLCALPLQSVRETMRMLPIEPLAGAPPSVLGLCLVRGSAIPVIDVGSLFGKGDPEARRLVTIAIGDRAIGLAVDAVLGVYPIAETALHDLPPVLREAAGEIITAIGRLDAELLVFLGTTRLLPHAALEALRAHTR